MSENSEKIMLRLTIDLYDNGALSMRVDKHPDANPSATNTLALGVLTRAMSHFDSPVIETPKAHKAALQKTLKSKAQL